MRRFEGAIGVLDSGVGGLTVVSELLRQGLRERIVYVADQAHVPYGGRPLEEIRGFATAISRFLAEEGCRAIAMACNISSATALDEVCSSYPDLKVVGVIRPGVAFAAEAAAPRIGVLATEGTVASGAYEREIYLLNPGAIVKQVACPKLVPLVESGQTAGEEARASAREYLAPLADADVDAVVLGCTHYPYLLSVLQREAERMFARSVRFVDPAEETAKALLAALGARQGPDRAPVPLALLTTGSPETLDAQAATLLPGIALSVSKARWSHSPPLSLSLAT